MVVLQTYHFGVRVHHKTSVTWPILPYYVNLYTNKVHWL